MKTLELNEADFFILGWVLPTMQQAMREIGEDKKAEKLEALTDKITKQLGQPDSE